MQPSPRVETWAASESGHEEGRGAPAARGGRAASGGRLCSIVSSLHFAVVSSFVFFFKVVQKASGN